MYTVEDWIADLRSGKYKQWKGMLECSAGYCCLGVLAANLEVEGVVRQVNDDCVAYYEHELDHNSGVVLSSEVLPQQMATAVGLRSLLGAFYIRRLDPEVYARVLDSLDEHRLGDVKHAYDTDSTISLAALNDYGVPFEVIADVIEARPERLFVDGT